MTPVFKSAEGRQAVHGRYAEILAHWPVPHRQLRLPTCEGETFVIASGPEGAPAVLLLHGSATTSAMWMGDVGAWAEGFAVYAVDMIGEAGFSAPSRPPLASDRYALWLDDVMRGLGLERASLVGISLGGWLALDYATRRPERVEQLAVMCPGGVGRHVNILIWAVPLLMLGSWGRKKLAEAIGVPPPSPEAQAFAAFAELIYRHFRPRMDRLPVFDDAALRRLTMPVLAILGGKDPMIDTAGVRRRLEANLPEVEVSWLPDARHYLPGQTGPILGFLSRSSSPVGRGNHPHEVGR